GRASTKTVTTWPRGEGPGDLGSSRTLAGESRLRGPVAAPKVLQDWSSTLPLCRQLVASALLPLRTVRFRTGFLAAHPFRIQEGPPWCLSGLELDLLNAAPSRCQAGFARLRSTSSIPSSATRAERRIDVTGACAYPPSDH